MKNSLFNTAHAQDGRNATQVDVLNQVVPRGGFNAQNQNDPFSLILNQIFYAGLVVAVALAVLMIVRGGIQYMTTDSVDGKGGAKLRIQAAVGGLVLAFASILILNTINPSLTRTDLNIEPVNIAAGNAPGLEGTPNTVTSGTRPSDPNNPATGQSSVEGGNEVVKGDFSRITAADLRPHLGSNYTDADVQAFIDAGRQYNIDPRFLAAVSMLETTNGTSKAFTDGRNNAMGTSNSVGPIGFSSVRESIFTQANSLTREGGKYSGANTIEQIGAIYSPPIDPETGKPYANDLNGTNWYWGEGVTKNYNKIIGRYGAD